MDIERELEAERRLAEDLADYVGMWVAVRNHKVVASASTLDELMKQIDPLTDIIFQVFEGPFFGLAA